MTGPNSLQQQARVMAHVSRSARAYGERHLASLSPERRAQLEREWANPCFDAGNEMNRRCGGKGE